VNIGAGLSQYGTARLRHGDYAGAGRKPFVFTCAAQAEGRSAVVRGTYTGKTAFAGSRMRSRCCPKHCREAAGSLTITGLPVASKNVTGNYAAVTIPYWQTLTTSMVHMGGYVAPNTATITLVRAAAAAASTAALTVADISGTTQIIVSSTYVVQ
jgi:hypothetical protein